MAYTTNAAVALEFKSLSYDASAVASSTVDEWISQSDAYINAKIGLKYVTPVSGVESLKILKNISTWLVAARLIDTLKTLTGSQMASQNSNPYSDPKYKADKMIKEIISGEIPLSDAELADSSDGVRGYNYDDAEDSEAANFQVGVDQW